ncbi:MAG: hypothetical protein PHF56_02245 [Desulfuromonadaceae bacterium]|nr:hypothetical protein [Desulfuromonadaceae bacterium]
MSWTWQKQRRQAIWADSPLPEIASPEALAELNRKIQIEIEQDHLVIVEFYDAGSQKITEAVKPNAKELEAKLPKHGSEFAGKGGIVCTKLALNGDTFMRVFVPLLPRLCTRKSATTKRHCCTKSRKRALSSTLKSDLRKRRS